MSTPSSTPAVSPLVSLARHWLSSALLMLLGLLLGVGAALSMPTEYRAETRLAIVPASTSAYGIPGYPQGARELAADYARWVQNTVSTEGLPEGATQAVASPVPETAVIVVEGRGTSQESARATAAQTSKNLLDKVGEALALRDPQTAYKQFTDLQPKVSEAQAAVDAAQTRYSNAVGGDASAARIRAAADELNKARSTYAEVSLQQNALADQYRRLQADTQGNSRLTEVSPVADSGDNRSALLARWGLVGLGLGYITAQCLAIARDRRRVQRG